MQIFFPVLFKGFKINQKGIHNLKINNAKYFEKKAHQNERTIYKL